MLLAIILMGLALFIWGGDLERKGEEGLVGTEAVQKEKKGFAGVMEKVKRVIKGEKAGPKVAAEAGGKAVVSGEGGVGDAGQAAGGGAGGAQGAAGNSLGGAVEKSTALAESIGAEGKSPAERDRLLKEKFGHMEEDRSQGGSGEAVTGNTSDGGGVGQAGGGGGSSVVSGDELEAARKALAGGGGSPGMELPAFGEGEGTGSELTAEAEKKARVALGAAGAGSGAGLAKGVQAIPKRRGGSFGSSTGAATATGTRSQYQRWRGDFSTSGSDLEFEVIYQEAGGQLQFRCFVMPYDAQTAKLFSADKGDFLLSFRDEDGQRLVPAEGDLAIPLTQLTAFEAQGKVTGWVARGMIPLNSQELSNLKSVKLGWDFDKDLGDWLKELKTSRGK